jgi:hypothetical protein
MMSDTKHVQSWPELAIGLYDRLTERNAEITYEANDLEIHVPSAVGSEAVHAKWVVNGSLSIRTRDQQAG